MYNFNRDVIPWYILQNVIDVCDRLHFTFVLIKRLLFFIYKFYIIFFYRQRYGQNNVIMSDILKPPQEILESGK